MRLRPERGQGMPVLRRVTGGRPAARLLGLMFLVTGLGAAMPDAARFETEMGPTPINSTTKNTVLGHGSVIATLSGGTLAIEGSFEGLATPATDAHLMMGQGIGIPGGPIRDLKVSSATAGSVTGSFTLGRAQLTALRKGLLYIQINSQKAPAPGGNLWGWLLPEHVKAGQDEPILGNWYLPQGEGLKAALGRDSKS
jgi:hypothetical protein